MRLVPAAFPFSTTSQSPSQKSNWRYSAAEQGRGAGVAADPSEGGRTISISPTVKARMPARAGSAGSAMMSPPLPFSPYGV